MIALLVIQAFQTAQLYDRKSTQFKTNLNTSLERIAIRHEKAEDIRRYMHIVDRDFSGQYKDILKEEFKQLLSAQESISIQDTAIFEKGELPAQGTPDDELSDELNYSDLSNQELENAIKKAVKKEDYELAARLRDEISKRTNKTKE